MAQLARPYDMKGIFPFEANMNMQGMANLMGITPEAQLLAADSGSLCLAPVRARASARSVGCRAASLVVARADRRKTGKICGAERYGWVAAHAPAAHVHVEL